MLQNPPRRGTLAAMSEQHTQSRVARTSDTIIGPAKWFAAGGITIGAVVGLVFAFMNASPRALPPMMNTESVALAPTDTQSADSPHASAAPIEVPSLTTTTTGPARPLSSATEALLVPRANTTTPSSLSTTPATPRVTDSPKVEPAPQTPVAPLVAPQTPPSANPSTPAKPQSPNPTSPKPQSPAIAGGTINLNTATASELELLPQIGPALAARIIDYRTTHGPYRQLADLDKVKGIGPKTLDKLKGLVRFE